MITIDVFVIPLTAARRSMFVVGLGEDLDCAVDHAIEAAILIEGDAIACDETSSL